MTEQASELRWGVERRLEFIEFRLYWDGYINRGDITNQFGVSVPQASKDLSQYQEFAAGNMEYDKSEKRYFAASKFKPRFLKPDPNAYLSQLRSMIDGTASVDESWLSFVPNAACVPVLYRRIEPGLLRGVLRAIRGKQSLKIFYKSMNPERREAIWRSISPHAFASDGERWHVRAYCHIREGFRDFVLSRCLEFEPSGKALRFQEDDSSWNTFVELQLKPNPNLTKQQQEVIVHDFDLDSGHAIVSVRASLLFYFKRRLKLDLSESNPNEAPVVIANRSEFESALEAASKS